MAQLKIQVSVLPPTLLGTTQIYVPLGTTIPITKAMLMNSIPPYFQEQDLPMGGLQVHSRIDVPFTEVLANSNQATTKVALFKNTTRIYVANQSSLFVMGGTFSNAEMNANYFKVTGVALGTTKVDYIAKAVSTSNQESVYSSIKGTIVFTVIPNTPNQMPSAIGNSSITCPVGGSVLLDYNLFTTGYADPENDVPYKVKFSGLPAMGKVLFMGQEVVNGQELELSLVQSNPLVYIAENAPLGSMQVVNFGVSDVVNQGFKY